MQIARFEPLTVVEGPGRRTAIWFQGCTLQCENCCNPLMQPVSGGQETGLTELCERIRQSRSDGLTLLGGEPLDQADELFPLLRELRNCYNGDIMLFTGYTWEQIQTNSLFNKTAGLCDLVIAGPFVDKLVSGRRRWIGSDNQTVHFVTERMAFLRNAWPEEKKEIEIIIKDGEILVNGSVIDQANEVEKMFASMLKE